MITVRPSSERGRSSTGWLHSAHSFSFGDYFDLRHPGNGNLLALNDDTVAPGKGFGTHGHRDMEIVSDVLEGALAHQDNMHERAGQHAGGPVASEAPGDTPPTAPPADAPPAHGTAPMTPDNAFIHLPKLQGRLTPAHASGLRLTDEVLAEWDAQARCQGLPAHWRLPDHKVEQSLREVLAAITAQQQDLWVFAYGSLMWNPGFHFGEVRRACLPGFARRFALSTTIGRGTPDCPGLVLTLQRTNDADQVGCEGLAFRIPAPLVEDESRMLWRREMITGAYCPQLLPLPTPQGEVQALVLVLVANTAHPHYRGDLTLQATVAIIATACGRIGSNRDYLEQLVQQCEMLGIEDSYVRELAALVDAACGRSR